MKTPPKKTTIALDFLGCKLNQAENQELARKLEAAGYTIVEPSKKADIYILNTCSVTLTADSKSRHLLRSARRRHPSARLIAIGCYAHRAPAALEGIEGVELVLGNDNKMELAGLLGEAVKPKAAPPAEKQRTRSFIKIQQGCRNFCAYCIVPYVRSKESSVPLDEVLALVQELTAEGCKEIVLTGTEIGTYHHQDTRLEGLISRILEKTDTERIRMSSLQPHHITPGLLRLWGDKRLCPHFHLSLQSGSDLVLKRMRRQYLTAGYRRAVELIRQTLPDAGITTDVIVGFPGETDAEFKETLAFCQSVKFARIHVFPYSQRPGTAAAVMPGQVPDNIKKERTAQMLALAKDSAKAFHQSYTGKTLEVLWEQQASGVWSGYTANYIKVYTRSSTTLANTVTKTKLTKLYREGMWGET